MSCHAISSRSLFNQFSILSLSLTILGQSNNHGNLSPLFPKTIYYFFNNRKDCLVFHQPNRCHESPFIIFLMSRRSLYNGDLPGI